MPTDLVERRKKFFELMRDWFPTIGKDEATEKLEQDPGLARSVYQINKFYYLIYRNIDHALEREDIDSTLDQLAFTSRFMLSKVVPDRTEAVPSHTSSSLIEDELWQYANKQPDAAIGMYRSFAIISVLAKLQEKKTLQEKIEYLDSIINNPPRDLTAHHKGLGGQLKKIKEEETTAIKMIRLLRDDLYKKMTEQYIADIADIDLLQKNKSREVDVKLPTTDIDALKDAGYPVNEFFTDENIFSKKNNLLIRILENENVLAGLSSSDRSLLSTFLQPYKELKSLFGEQPATLDEAIDRITATMNSDAFASNWDAFSECAANLEAFTNFLDSLKKNNPKTHEIITAQLSPFPILASISEPVQRITRFTLSLNPVIKPFDKLPASLANEQIKSRISQFKSTIKKIDNDTARLNTHELDFRTLRGKVIRQLSLRFKKSNDDSIEKEATENAIRQLKEITPPSTDNVKQHLNAIDQVETILADYSSKIGANNVDDLEKTIAQAREMVKNKYDSLAMSTSVIKEIEETSPNKPSTPAAVTQANINPPKPEDIDDLFKVLNEAFAQLEEPKIVTTPPANQAGISDPLLIELLTEINGLARHYETLKGGRELVHQNAIQQLTQQANDIVASNQNDDAKKQGLLKLVEGAFSALQNEYLNKPRLSRKSAEDFYHAINKNAHGDHYARLLLLIAKEAYADPKLTATLPKQLVQQIKTPLAYDEMLPMKKSVLASDAYKLVAKELPDLNDTAKYLIARGHNVLTPYFAKRIWPVLGKYFDDNKISAFLSSKDPAKFIDMASQYQIGIKQLLQKVKISDDGTERYEDGLDKNGNMIFKTQKEITDSIANELRSIHHQTQQVAAYEIKHKLVHDTRDEFKRYYAERFKIDLISPTEHAGIKEIQEREVPTADKHSDTNASTEARAKTVLEILAKLIGTDGGNPKAANQFWRSKTLTRSLPHGIAAMQEVLMNTSLTTYASKSAEILTILEHQLSKKPGLFTPKRDPVVKELYTLTKEVLQPHPGKDSESLEIYSKKSAEWLKLISQHGIPETERRSEKP